MHIRNETAELITRYVKTAMSLPLSNRLLLLEAIVISLFVVVLESFSSNIPGTKTHLQVDLESNFAEILDNCDNLYKRDDKKCEN